MDRRECDRMFVAVLETGSFAKAALRLGTSPGQASKLVSKLEADLGVRLLSRTTRSLSATEVGQGYFERIKPLIEEMDALDASVRNASGAPSGRLRLTAPISFGNAQLAPVLMAFAEAYGDIQIDCSFSDRVVSLVDEGFDVAIRIGKPADSSLIARKLCDARVVVVASPGYIAQRGEPFVPGDLSQHACIIDTNFREPLIWRFSDPVDRSALAVDVRGRLHFSSAEVCVQAAEARLGIARAPSFMAGESIKEGKLVNLLALYESNPLGIYAVYPPGRHLAGKVRVFIDFLVEQLKGEPVWDQGW